jgi:TPR repeat protein
MGLCSTSPGWTALLDALYAEKDLAFLPDREKYEYSLCHLLRAPVTLSLWIERFMPHLARQPKLDILIAGVEHVDGRHDGIWYQLMPYLLDNPGLEVTVTLLFSSKADQRRAQDKLPALRAAGKHLRPAKTKVQTLGAYLANSRNPEPELLMLFQPGFEAAIPGWFDDEPRYSWLSPGQLDRALTFGFPIGATAYEMVEFEHEQWLLSAFGVRRLGEVVQSQYVIEPRAHVLDGPPVGWGSVLWQLDPASQVAEPASDSPVMASQRHLQSLGGRLFGKDGGAVDLWNFGRRRVLPVQATREMHEVIVLAQQLAVDPISGRFWEVDDRGRLTQWASSARLPENELATYPDKPDFAFERVLWAIDAYALALRLLKETQPPDDEAVDTGDEAEAEGQYKQKLEKFVQTVKALTHKFQQAGELAKLTEPEFLAARVVAAEARLEAGESLEGSDLKEVLLGAAERSVGTEHLERVALSMLQGSLPDPTLGRSLLMTLCAKEADPETRANFALCLHLGDGGAPDYAGAREQCLRLLESSDSPDHTKGAACSLLANQARCGKGEPVDVSAALKLLEQGASYGEGSCSFELAVYWDDGPHRSTDAVSRPEPFLSAKYYRQAIARGIDKAMVNLALLLSRHPECMEADRESDYWIKRAADAGDEIALEISRSESKRKKRKS